MARDAGREPHRDGSVDRAERAWLIDGAATRGSRPSSRPQHGSQRGYERKFDAYDSDERYEREEDPFYRDEPLRGGSAGIDAEEREALARSHRRPSREDEQKRAAYSNSPVDSHKENEGGPQYEAMQHAPSKGLRHQHAETHHNKAAPPASSDSFDANKDIEDIDRRLEALQDFLKAAKGPT